MILPTKGVPPRGALISVGAEILRLLNETKTVSRLWDDFRKLDQEARVAFDWFILSLELLFLLGAVDLDRGRLRREANHYGGEPLP